MKIIKGFLTQRMAIATSLVALMGLSVNVASLEPIDDATASQWLEKMASSFRSSDYDGVLVSNRGGKMRSVRIVHVVRDGMENERLEYLDGELVEVQRNSHPVDCIHAGKQLISESVGGGRFSAYANNSGVLPSSVYQLQVLSDSRVAGRPVSVIDVKPNDAHRYGHRLFLDQSSQLLLKSEVLDKQANVLESFQFTQIKVGDEVDVTDLEPDGQHAVEEEFHTLPLDAQSQQVQWRLNWLPPGFVAASLRRTAAGESDGVESMHYTDGFALFSVFLQPRENEVEAFETRLGSTLAYVTPKKMQGGWVSVTVVGELPLATAVQIAQGLEEDTLEPAE